jgi:exodeoxyribonuclease V alpha subunit
MFTTPRVKKPVVDLGDQKLILSGVVDKVLWPQKGQVSISGHAIVAILPDSITGTNGNLLQADDGRDLDPEEIIPSNSWGNVVVKGPLALLHERQQVELTGIVKREGRDLIFQCETYQQLYPLSRDEIIATLGCGIIPGCREGTAARIYEEYFNSTYVILDSDQAISKLVKISGIGKKTALKIKAGWDEHRGQAQLIGRLVKFGLSVNQCIKIYREWGSSAQREIEKNPYCLTRIHGIGFTTADKFALSVGILPDSPFRVEAGIEEALDRSQKDGHSFLWHQELIEATISLFRTVDDNPIIGQDLIEEQLKLAFGNGYLVRQIIDGEVAVYSKRLYDAEKTVSQRIRQIQKIPSRSSLVYSKLDDWSELWELAEEINGFSLALGQQEAVKLALTSGFSIITGGPGTGKSTLVKTIIKLFTQGQIMKIKLAAPSGKAAKRLAEVAGHDASTLHRLMEARPGGEFKRNRANPLDGDLVIIDETSMVDIKLMARLLDAVKDDQHVVLVGDVDQLPSVGPGNVLRDMIDCGAIPVAQLTEIFRQRGADNYIISNCHAINQGDTTGLKFRHPNRPEFDEDKNLLQEAYWFGIKDPLLLQKQIVNLVAATIPAKFGHQPDDIVVLTPMNVRSLGTIELNRLLQARLNPPLSGKWEIKYGKETIFRTGDRIMQTRNDYDKGVFNGDQGKITGWSEDDEAMEITWLDGTKSLYKKDEFADLKHCWAMTVHKAQGSEFPCVVGVCHTGQWIMLYRALLYTLCSRPQSQIILCGSQSAVKRAIENNSTAKRNSGLKWRLTR